MNGKSKLAMGSFFAMLTLGAGAAFGGETQTLRADDERLHYSDYSKLVNEDGVVRLERDLPDAGRHYQLDGPGARLRMRCDAATIVVKLRYGQRNDPARAQSATGAIRVDGAGRDEWTFGRARPGVEKETVSVTLPADGAMHDYELVMPYGDVVAVESVTVPVETKFETPAARPATRIAFFGDSVTHGFSASRVDRTFVFRVGERNGYETVNLGIAGQDIYGAVADQLKDVRADGFVVALGVNNWQGGVAPDHFQKQVGGFLRTLRRHHPDLPVVFVSPLWVADSWKPAAVTHPLPLYQEAARAAVAEGGFGPGLVRFVDGATLIDHDAGLFDSAVHPNDAGHAQMGERLAAAIKDFLPAKAAAGN